MKVHPAEVGRVNEARGFSSALFINLTRYEPNCLTPKRDAMDSFDKLSIESSTVTTPTSSEKRESKFKFCLSKDLLRRLDEESPIRKAKDNDNQTVLCPLVLDDEQTYSQSTKNENNSDSSFEPNGLFRRQVLNSFSTNNATSDSDSNMTPLKNDSSSEKSANGKSNTTGNDNEKISFEKTISQGNSTSSKVDASILPSNFSQFNQAQEDTSLINNKFNDVTQNCLMGNGFYNNSLMFLYGNMNGGGMNNNYAMQNININGKNGWICLLCSNFNYESKIIV
jgi:hypothetical protein